MAELGCKPIRDYITEDDETRRVRGYHTVDIRAATTRARSDDNDQSPENGEA